MYLCLFANFGDAIMIAKSRTALIKSNPFVRPLQEFYRYQLGMSGLPPGVGHKGKPTLADVEIEGYKQLTTRSFYHEVGG